MKKVGAVSAETKARIIQSAINEFSEHGYQNSSLRTICANAGVTTGALYFFFKNKEDLFNKIVESVMLPLEEYMKNYYAREANFTSFDDFKKDRTDYEVANHIVEVFLNNKKVWSIFLNNLVYPSIRKKLHQAIEDATEHYYEILSKAYENKLCKNKVEKFSVHQFAHIQVSIILTVFYHNFDDEELKLHIDTAVKMLRGAFFALLED